MRDQHYIVADGYERARAAELPSIRAQVELEYAERLHAAGWLERIRLRGEMQREVEKRLDRVAPRWALYIKE